MKPLPVCRVQKLALMLFTLLALRCGADQFVEVTAEIETIVWDNSTDNPPNVHVKNWTMRCVIGKNSWLIEGAPGHNWLFSGARLIEGRPNAKVDSDSLPGL